MKTYKSLERQSIILGMPAGDLMLLLCLLVLLVLLGGIMGTFMKVSKWYFVCAMLTVIMLQLVLRYLNRQKHPTFFASWTSYYFLQAHKIDIPLNPLTHEKHPRNKINQNGR